MPAEVLVNLGGTVSGSNVESESYQTMVEIVTEAGLGPSYVDELRFDAVTLIALAIQAAGTVESRSVRDAMIDVSRADEGDTDVMVGQWALARETLLSGGGINYEGASGSIEFSERGDPTTGVIQIWRVERDGSDFVVNTRFQEVNYSL